MGFPSVCIQGTAAPGLPEVGVSAGDTSVSPPAPESTHPLRAQEVPGLPKDAQVTVPALRKFRGRRGKKNPRSQFSEICALVICTDVRRKQRTCPERVAME